MKARMKLTGSWQLVASMLAGAALGWWMFHYRGAALFAGIGLATVLAFRAFSHFSHRFAAALALASAALALHASATLGWGGTDVPDGSRFKASPVGLSHVLTPDRPESRTVDCGWYRASGYPAPCEIGDPGAFARLRAVYPLLLVAALLSLGGAAFAMSRAQRARMMVPALAGAGGLAAFAGLALFAASVRPALAAIAELPVGVGGTLGTMELALALLLSLTVATHGAPSAAPAGAPAGVPPSRHGTAPARLS